jgi:transposase InsO family protein
VSVSHTISGSTGAPYGIQRVCRVWEQARSTFYARQARAAAPAVAPKRRGPKPALADDVLLAKIRADLAASPFSGEGHRKVWARLHFGQGLHVARKRVLRLMREHNLLSPHRSRPGTPAAHDGTIVTDAPNVLWGTDGAKVFTLDEGWVWTFVAVEHWNAECVGWHVAKHGNAYAALQPLAQGVTQLYGGVGADVARGLAVRLDHGTQYLSDHFVNQLRFWGIAPSFAFVAEPETNGVAERFIRTLKEQVIYGRTFRTAAEVRAAVAAFIARYNAEWRLEKNGYRGPAETRAAWISARLPVAA